MPNLFFFIFILDLGFSSLLHELFFARLCAVPSYDRYCFLPFRVRIDLKVGSQLIRSCHVVLNDIFFCMVILSKLGPSEKK